MLYKFNDFLSESVINQDVKKITELIYVEFFKNITEFKNDSILVLNDFLSKNYQDLIFDNDKISFILSDKYYSFVKSVDIYGVIISNLDISINLPINFNEESLKLELTHELTHLIELYYSKNNLSKSWNKYTRLREHQKRFQKYKYWINISHMFYDTLEQEMRSRASQTYQNLKSLNVKDVNILRKYLLQTDEYKKMNDILKINPDDILRLLKEKYSNSYEFILKDFMLNVLYEKYSIPGFIKEIDKIKTICQKQKKKLSKLISEIINEDAQFLEEYFENNINYCEYLTDEYQQKLRIKEIKKNRIKKIKQLL